MKLSVIIPFYNELNLINRAVNSVVINSIFFDQVEIILINDGSFEESEIRSCFKNNSNKLIKIVSNNYAKGPGGARNTGLDILKDGNRVSGLVAIWRDTGRFVIFKA